eukprot:NODE_8077_length_249_cov_228.670000_g7462_i0.p2 GENE.NODE_8077_length_249_cov_228.670000_g7462_i0~~NODE_8077_length_249_cov_228.670000_g7462_i0.p2  ORF type:complete len:59 (-),score=25.27 NODE_8077_length_249_cov_228.670000_g7462_i0:72-218(-)
MGDAGVSYLVVDSAGPPPPPVETWMAYKYLTNPAPDFTWNVAYFEQLK